MDGVIQGEAIFAKARGLGVPRTPEERVAAHYGIDISEARRWLQIHPESELLPERGSGFTRGTAALEVVRQGIGIAVPAGQKLTIMQGDIVRMHVAFDYRGTATSGTLYCSIGKVTLGIFDEIAVGTKVVSLPESVDFVPYTGFVDIDTSPVSPGANYDIYAKISEYIDQAYVEILDVIDVIGAPEFANFAITSYEIAP